MSFIVRVKVVINRVSFDSSARMLSQKSPVPFVVIVK
jgi:hypothetical protein